MNGKFDLASLIVGYALHVADVGLDFYVAIQYSIRGEWWWFSFTLAFIVLPLLVANFSICFSPLSSLFQVLIAYRDALRKWKAENWESPRCARNDWRCSCASCKLFCEKRKDSVESKTDLAETRYIETIAESAPQWCLQSYVMLRQWFFPWYTILSTIFSFLSLAWSITMLEKAEKLKEWYITKEKVKSYPGSPSYVTSFGWQFCGLLSRLPALVIFAYAFSYYVFVVFGVHWAVLIWVLYAFDRNDSDDERQNFGFIPYCVCTSYLIMFHISEYTSKLVFGENFRHHKRAIISYHILLSFFNLILASLAVWQTPATVTLTDNLRNIVLFVVFLGVIAATMFILLHYHYHQLNDFEEDNNCEEPQINHIETENVATESSV